MASPEDDFSGDSLFEGMVLFSPSDISPTPPSPPPPPQEPPSPPPKTPSPPPTPATVKSQSQSQPLDEDLFSDLTLQSQQDSQPQTLEPDPVPAISRQISRKKKRAVRVGYARNPVEESSPRTIPIEIKASPDHQVPSESSDRTKDEILAPVIEEQVTKTEDDEQTQQKEEEAHEKEEALASIEEKLEIVRGQILSKLGKIRETAGMLSKQRKEFGRRRRKAMENVNLASEKYKELERELEEACEAEDFERAERVSECLAEKEKEKVGLMSELRDVELKCDAVDLKMQEVLELRIAAEEEGAVLMEQFAKVWGSILP